MINRKLRFAAVLAMAVLIGAGGFLLGRQLKSPEDARVAVAAPEPSLIGVPVESLALSNDVVVRGDAQFEGAVDLKLDAALGDGKTRVVTNRVPEVDSTVNEGDILIEVSGRPVFLLQGDLPAFREYKPGLEGDDVLQLEQALKRLGFLDAEPDRLFGQATEDAIAKMYEAAGYEARAATAAEETQLKSARDAVDNARKGLADANDALSKTGKGKTQAQKLQEAMTRRDQVDAIKRAQEALDKVQNTQSSAVLSAMSNLEDASTTGDTKAITASNQALASAQQARRESITQAEQALKSARRALADADALRAAQANDSVDTTSATNAVTRAQESLDRAQADLDRLESEIGVRLPQAEIVFLKSVPRSVTSVDVSRGDVVSGSVMRISGTEVRITSAVSESNRRLLTVGQKVVIDSAQLGIETEGEITELADRTGTNGAASNRYHMVVVPKGDYKVSEMVGLNFRIKIPLEKSEGEVLAVPLAALSAGADGSSRVEVIVKDKETRLVAVNVGLSDKNRSLVEITSENAGDLKPGDMVVIGVENPVAATGGTSAGADGGADAGEPAGGADGGEPAESGEADAGESQGGN